MPRYNTEDNFWDLVNIQDDNTCWNWKGTLSPKGYGRFHWHGKEIKAHVLAYKLVHGNPEYQVMHDCMNKPCCNPKHLFDGTTAENHQYPDNAVLNLRLVQVIRHIRQATNFSYRKIASLMRLCPNTVYDVIAGKTWRNSGSIS